MQSVDKFMLAIAIVWTLFIVYAVLMLLPFVDQRLRNWDAKIKRGKVPISSPNRPQRVVFLLLTCLMAASAFTSAYHHELSKLMGVSSWLPVFLMMLLPLVYFALGWLKKQ